MWWKFHLAKLFKKGQPRELYPVFWLNRSPSKICTFSGFRWVSHPFILISFWSNRKGRKFKNLKNPFFLQGLYPKRIILSLPPTIDLFCDAKIRHGVFLAIITMTNMSLVWSCFSSEDHFWKESLLKCSLPQKLSTHILEYSHVYYLSVIERLMCVNTCNMLYKDVIPW